MKQARQKQDARDLGKGAVAGKKIGERDPQPFLSPGSACLSHHFS